MICNSCTKSIRKADNYCPFCGIQVVEITQFWENEIIYCEACGIKLNHNHNFCFKCGKPAVKLPKQ